MGDIQFSEDDLQIIPEPLKEKFYSLLNFIEALQKKNNQLIKENQQLKRELAKVKHQAPQPSFQVKNYSLTLTLKKMTKQNIWKKSNKKEKIAIDKIVVLPEVTVCRDCGNEQFVTIRTDKKIVQGVILKRNNICYLKKDKQCKQCKKIYKGVIPEEIKRLEFDQEIRTLISYLKFKCRITQPLLHDMLTDIGITISTGQISHILLENSRKLIPAYTQLRVWGIKQSSYLQTDATGHKFKSPSGKIMDQHIHFLGNSRLSLFKITPRYNAAIMEQVLTSRGKKKPLVSDDGGANGARLFLTKKQLCWIHEIRHYVKLLPVLSVHKDLLKANLQSSIAFIL